MTDNYTLYILPSCSGMIDRLYFFFFYVSPVILTNCFALLTQLSSILEQVVMLVFGFNSVKYILY